MADRADSSIVSTPASTPSASETVRMAEMLLRELEQASCGSTLPVIESQPDSQLIQVRLGIAGSLFHVLRCRQPGMASHSLRVALTTSAWALWKQLPSKHRDVIEIAALLHDIGMVGLPDQVLLKPGPLDADEARLVEQARHNSLEILRSACAEPAILDVVENVGAWYDGFKAGYRVVGEEIPLGARMIAIVEAFDAMTTDHVFRPAMSHERAMHELFEFAGNQFDPELVRQFDQFHAGDLSQLRTEVAQRWLRTLDPEVVSSYWELNRLPRQLPAVDEASFFQNRLLDYMHDAVVFIDAGVRVVQWNHGAERLTGIPADTVLQRPWSPTILATRNEKGQLIDEEDCPVSCALESGVQSLRRLTITGRSGRCISVDTHTIPVTSEDGTVLGAILLLHDASPETSLEERCQTLHEKATKDPLTQVANRAEMDRVHEAFVRRYKEQGVPCSLIICDLDLFKQVNDTYGHQAGDDAIVSLANLLKNFSQPGDLVARYGGEEFVMLCANCDNATAARRAEKIRQALAQLSQPRMDGRSVTASFGVTEIQPGDTPETMLRRSDRGLLLAKAKGRNTVVQLGSGSTGEGFDDTPPLPRGFFWWRKPSGPVVSIQQDLITPVPIKIAIEKLRGFMADHQAKIETIKGNHVTIEIDEAMRPCRRQSDRPMTFAMQLRFEEEQVGRTDPSGNPTRTFSRTRIHVSITPRKNRDRRRNDADERAREVLTSLRSYLMASVEDAPNSKGVLRRAKAMLAPWLTQH